MSVEPDLTHIEQRFLPTIAKAFAEQGYQAVTMRRLAADCGVDVYALKQRWPSKTAVFIAAVEYAYEVAERTWTMLLSPDPPPQVAERLLAFAASCGDEFTVSRMFWVGFNESDRPRVRNTLRRLNRRFARYLAGAVSDLHVAQLGGADGQVSLRSQAGAVLRLLAHVQQEADQLVDCQRAELANGLEAVLSDARPKSPDDSGCTPSL